MAKKPQMQVNPSGSERFYCPAWAYLSWMTSFTEKGKLNMLNRKPFRSAEQKVIAFKQARKTAGGFWRSDAPVAYH